MRSKKFIYYSFFLAFVSVLILPKFALAESPVIEKTELVNLSVPFVPEAPDGLMTRPWNNSCEEASVSMLDEFYFGNTESKIAKKDAKKAILKYVNIENKIFGYNANTDAKEIVKLINNYSPNFESRRILNPKLSDIQNEIRSNRPVIALLYGKNLNNPRIAFARNGSYYHTLVIKGFDDSTEEFIVNDNGDLKKGLDLRYSYDTILGALRDYSHKKAKTVEPATAIFTSQRRLVKTKDSNRIYLLKDGKKYYITSPEVFKEKSWKWSWVTTVEKTFLDKLPAGPSFFPHN